MELELFNTIFELRKANGIVFNIDHSIHYINNIQYIVDEFFNTKSYVEVINSFLDNLAIVYDSAIDSYINQPNIDIENRESYIFGVAYAKLYEQNYTPKDKDFDTLLINHWQSFTKFANSVLPDAINQYSYLGVKDQVFYGYYNIDKRKK